MHKVGVNPFSRNAYRWNHFGCLMLNLKEYYLDSIQRRKSMENNCVRFSMGFHNPFIPKLFKGKNMAISWLVDIDHIVSFDAVDGADGGVCEWIPNWAFPLFYKKNKWHLAKKTSRE